MVEALDIKKFVNGIFAKKGFPPVKNFADEFSDGSKFLQLDYLHTYNPFSQILITLQHSLR